MGVELRPLGVLCNIQCQYCYQHPQRDAGNLSRLYDLTLMKQAVEAEGQPFTLFGGEPLLLPLGDLEDLWAWGFERFGGNQLQTNGTLITEDHIRLFHTYRVRVCISLDGPGALNDARWHGSLARTRESTDKAHTALRRLVKEGLTPALIVTLHRVNADAARLPALLDWIRDLDAVGVRHIRLHLLESESAHMREILALSEAENLSALHALMALERELPRVRFDLFPEMRRLLVGDDREISCVWYNCDPYTTHAVRGVEGHGQRSNCGRTNKDGVDFVKSTRAGYERFLALYHTPQDAGGCQGCRFFMMCKGQCPGTAIDGDWRNRTEHCGVWKGLYAVLEEELLEQGVEPLSMRPDRPLVEEEALRRWAQGRPATMWVIAQTHLQSNLPGR
jgi:uncharacterized protein